MFPSQTIDWSGREVTLTWIKLNDDSDLVKFQPITQAYGICFNDKKEILILDQKGDSKWTLPGGTLEVGETPIQTLIREVMEEADITLKNISLLGVQRVEDPQNLDPKEKLHFQVRFIAKVDQIQFQTIDPAKDRIHVRRFVPISAINNCIHWGSTGEALFRDAEIKFKKLTKE